MINELKGPVLSPKSGKKAKQLVILLHGYGADGANLIGLGAEWADALPDAEFIAPNAPYTCEMSPFGYQWFSLVDRTPAVIFDFLKEVVPVLDRFINAELKKRDLTEKDLALVGFSQGTMMSLYVAPRRENCCAGILGYSGRLFGEENLTAEGKSKPPIMLIHGEADDVVPFASMAHAEAELTEKGFSVETHARPNLPHSIDQEGVQLGEAFLKEIFKL
ncbi:MAG: alpha/beta hydrolase [Alphaproteobacteria bacterium]